MTPVPAPQPPGRDPAAPLPAGAASHGQQLKALQSAMRYDPVSAALGAWDSREFRMVDASARELVRPGEQAGVRQFLANLPAQDGVWVLPAFFAQEHQAWYLPLVLTTGSAGPHRAAYFALVSPQRLLGSATSIRLLPEAFVIFATADGTRLFRYQVDTRTIEVSNAPMSAASLEHLRAGGEGYYEAPATTTGQWTHFGYSVSRRVPIGAMVAIPSRVSRLAWLQRSAGEIVMLALACTAVLFFGSRLRTSSASLRQSRQWYRELFTSVDQGLVVVSRKGTILTCNPAAISLLGAASGRELAGRELPRLTRQDHAAGITIGKAHSLLESLQPGQAVLADWQFSRLDAGGAVEVEMRLAPFPSGGADLVSVLLRDVRRERHHLQRQEFLATHDNLTGLLNRYAFQTHLQERTENQPGRPFGIILLDVNRFKDINDTLGHHAGDVVISQLARRTNAAFVNCDSVVARLGGDELAVCLPLDEPTNALDRAAEQWRGTITHAVTVAGVELELSASLGAAAYPLDATSPMNLLRCAEIAMYAAKRQMLPYQRYTETMDHFTPEALALRSDFARAIRDGGLGLAFQPQVGLGDGRLVRVEALARWVHPLKGAIAPGVFVPLAENSELIYPFTEYVMRHALAHAARWRREDHRVPVAVNISAQNLMDVKFVELVGGLLEHYGVAAPDLELEVTESALMRNPQSALRRLRELRALGVRLAIDDFGTGYASLAYLKQLPVHVLKIDKTFTADLASDDDDKRIVRMAISLAHGFGLEVVAEGVETPAVADFLAAEGCDVAQGYLYEKPLGAEEFSRKWLQDTARAPAAAALASREGRG